MIERDEVDVARLATSLGVDEQVVRVHLAVLAAKEAGARRRGRGRWAVLAASVLLLGTLGSLRAIAQASCMQTLPAPLVTMCPDSPALASEVNQNFSQLVTWLQQKLGPVGTGNVAIPGTLATTSLRATGLVEATAGLNANTAQIGTLTATSLTAGATTLGPLNAGSSTLGATTITSPGGNVPHLCVVRRADGRASRVNCLANEIAISGSAICPSTWRPYQSFPVAGSDAALAGGQVATGWRTLCQVWGDSGATINADVQFAVCCRQ